MKIILLSNNTWSIYNFRKEIISYFITKGYKVYVYAPDDFNLNSKIDNIKVINTKLKNKNSFIDFYYIIRLIYYLIRIKPSIVLSYHIKPNIFISLINYFFKIKIIVNITGLGSSIINKGLKRKLIILLYRLALRKTQYVFFQNKNDRNLFLRLGIVRKMNSDIVPGSGINLTKNKIKKNFNYTNTFMYIGRLIEDKGIYELIDAIKKIKKIDESINFIFVGNFDENNPRSVDKNIFFDFIKNYQIKYYKFNENIELFYDKCDAIILPTYREGTPRVLLEAMARGINVLCSNVVGCKHLIKHNYNGILFKKKNSTDMANKIINFKNKSIKQKIELATNAREFVERYQNVNILIDIYNKKIIEILNDK